MKTLSKPSLFVPSLLGIFLLIGTSLSLAGPDDANIVTDVKVKGNRTVATSTIMGQVRTEIGRPLSTAQLSEDLKRLYGLGFFKDVKIEQDTSGGSLVVIFNVTEKATLQKVDITGSKVIHLKDIRKKIRAAVGDYVDEQSIRTDTDAIRALYHEKGFYDASVSYRLDYSAQVNEAVLTLTIDEGAKKKIKKILFEGAISLKTKALKKAIQTKEAAWFQSGMLKEDILELDVQRILAAYDEEGFSEAKVTYRLEPVEKGGAGDTYLIFVIDEGRQYLVGDVSIEGNTVFSDEAIITKLFMKPGKPFSRRHLRTSVNNIQELYFEKGYMNAKILFDSVYNEKTGLVDTKYGVNEGEVTRVGHVRVEGNTKTKDIVIRRELRTYPGEAFNGTELRRSKERLFNLGYFEEVQFDVEDTDDPNRKDLVVRVKESKTGEFSFGGGFSSIDRVLGFIQIRQRNFDIEKYPTFTGGGQDMRLRAELSEVRSNGELSWTDPWFMGNPFSLGFDLFRREFNRTRSSGLFFDETRVGFQTRFGKELTDFDRIGINYRVEEIEISDIPEESSEDVKAERGENVISSLSFGYTHDKRNNRLVPSSGYILSGGAENSGGVLGGDKDFWKLTGSAAAYFPHFEDLVLELKIRGGLSESYNDTPKVPIYERFYVGGANTVRGYRERRIGPRDSGTRDPIGGESYWVGNAEYTFPIYPGIIKGALFYDIGAAYLDSASIGDGEIAAGVGIGFRVKTPIGPVKIDMGYPLDDVDGEDKEVRFHFNISQGF